METVVAGLAASATVTGIGFSAASFATTGFFAAAVFPATAFSLAVIESGTGALLWTGALFTDLGALTFAADFAAVFVVAAGFAPLLFALARAGALLAAAGLRAVDLTADALAVAALPLTPRDVVAGAFVVLDAVPACALAFTADLVAVFAPNLAGALALVLAAVFAVLAADLAPLVLAVRTGADAAFDFPAVVAGLPAVFPTLDPDLAALDSPAEEVVRERADLAAGLRVRATADVAPAPFFLSFFLADGIRWLLLLRPAVETGRILQTPCSGGRSIAAVEQVCRTDT